MADESRGARDRGFIGWGVLGFAVPLAGLVLFVVWSDARPRCARAAGVGAIVALAAGIALDVCSVFM